MMASSNVCQQPALLTYQVPSNSLMQYAHASQTATVACMQEVQMSTDIRSQCSFGYANETVNWHIDTQSNLERKQPSIGALTKSCSENMQQTYRRTPMPKCDFNKVPLLFGMVVFSCKFAAYFQLWRAASLGSYSTSMWYPRRHLNVSRLFKFGDQSAGLVAF